jgi:5-formyltetrahydrofolate cyclo-ligase
VTADVRAAKAQLRAAALTARDSMTAEQRARAGDAIAAVGMAKWAGLSTVAAYLAIRGEPPTAQLLDGLASCGTRVLLPVIDGAVLDWAQYDGSRTITAGPLGISEPIGPRLGTDAILRAELVLTPALAADRKGNRLGRGRGYYDRSLVAVAAPIVAVIYDSEFIDDVPIEAHDRRVDGVLRPAGFTSLS